VPVDAIVGSQGRLVAAGSVAVVESVENVKEDGTVYIGSSDAPVHLWIWRPSSSPLQVESSDSGLLGSRSTH
jgi:hypothetical protein